MIIKLDSIHKSIGAKDLYTDVTFTINPGEKVGLIGRNGCGKSTLLKIIAGEDHEYFGEFETRKNITIIRTEQEHSIKNDLSALEYILNNVPDYNRLTEIITAYEAGNTKLMHEYTDAVDKYSDEGYYYIKDLIVETLKSYGFPQSAIDQPFNSLSGGQKRFVELTRTMYAKADLALLDEPTNHMDYIGKEMFISWLKNADEAVLIVTHDRDVLRAVDKIIEIKELKSKIFDGNFDSYLKQNTVNTTNSVIQYNNDLKRLEEARKRMEWGDRMRAKSKAWKVRYDHWKRDYETIKAEVVKPSFWIDQESQKDMDERVLENYDKFKEKNINIRMKSTTTDHKNMLIRVENLSLGYSSPLFTNCHFMMGSGERTFIKGRNGAGKSSLIKAIISAYNKEKYPEAIVTEPGPNIFDGTIKFNIEAKIGQYEQEIDTKYLSMPLGDAIQKAYEEQGIYLEDKKRKSLLAQYLFDPMLDEKKLISNLSGGQKARFQLIKLLTGSPNVLILDEPTNHLDLPSIEELENSLATFTGAILFISHDNYFIKNIGGKTITIGE
jgi:ATPase subunit of ABC transporter with duplicated ATPase domains